MQNIIFISSERDLARMHILILYYEYSVQNKPVKIATIAHSSIITVRLVTEFIDVCKCKLQNVMELI